MPTPSSWRWRPRCFFFFNDTATTEIYTLSLHDALPIYAGVHALGQVVSTQDAPDDIDLIKVRDSLNTMLSPHVSVRQCSRVAEGFHARFSARSRTYVYAILEGDVPDPFLAR